MTRLQSTKRNRLLALVVFILLSLTFLTWKSSQTYEVSISPKSNKQSTSPKSVLGQKSYGSRKAPSKENADEEVEEDEETERYPSANRKAPKRPSTDDKVPKKGSKSKPVKATKENPIDDGPPPVAQVADGVLPERVHPPPDIGDLDHFQELEENTRKMGMYKKNPKNFLGDLHELKEDELDAIGDIYDDDIHKQPELIGVPPHDFIGDEIFDMEDKTPPELPQNFGRISIRDATFRIYSHNVKNGGHKALVPGEEPWTKRFRKITASIHFNAQRDSIVCLQEVYKFQLNDIMKELNRYSPNEDWKYYGVGRIDGMELGEFVPIIYKESEWELVFSDSLWLNEKNTRSSLTGWDAQYPRIVSYVTMKHKGSENYINVFNTHLDHVGEKSKIGSVKLIGQTMKSINSWPSFLCGDFNTEPDDAAFKQLEESFSDVSTLSTPFNRYGHEKSSVTGFEGEVLLQGGQSIDYIFAPKYTAKMSDKPQCDSIDVNSAANKLFLRLQGFGMLHSKFGGSYMSDHRPIVADFSLSGKC
ncbi:hypothetical protein G9P44_005640 [Scheffersomyces stipitis]|nr:hypothetical protein G9P44_005640 [Scheffersomyces stipitis]